MNLICRNRITTAKPQRYAATEDFAELFREEMPRLYLLALLLTSDHEKAEHCFVAALEDCVNGNPVFKEWAPSWARRMIVENAIRIVAPHPNYAVETALALDSEFRSEPQTLGDKDALIASVLELADFDRFAFVMSVLERYPDRDCSIQLGCTPHQLGDARMRAYRQLARSCARNAVPARADSPQRSRSGDPGALGALVAEFRIAQTT